MSIFVTIVLWVLLILYVCGSFLAFFVLLDIVGEKLLELKLTNRDRRLSDEEKEKFILYFDRRKMPGENLPWYVFITTAKHIKLRCVLLMIGSFIATPIMLCEHLLIYVQFPRMDGFDERFTEKAYDVLYGLAGVRNR